VNEIPSFHTVRPPQGLVKKHEPKDSRTATFVGILKPPTFSASPTKHSLAPKAAGKQIQFLPPEQNSLAIIPRVEEERNEELWWTMEDLDRSSAEADQESMVEELEALEELRLKQGGQLTPQQQQTENELRMQLAQAQQEQHMQQLQMQLELQGYDLSQMDPDMQQQLLMSMDPMMYGLEGEEEEEEGDQWLPPDPFLQQHMQQQEESQQPPWVGGVGLEAGEGGEGAARGGACLKGITTPTNKCHKNLGKRRGKTTRPGKNTAVPPEREGHPCCRKSPPLKMPRYRTFLRSKVVPRRIPHRLEMIWKWKWKVQ